MNEVVEIYYIAFAGGAEKRLPDIARYRTTLLANLDRGLRGILGTMCGKVQSYDNVSSAVVR